MLNINVNLGHIINNSLRAPTVQDLRYMYMYMCYAQSLDWDNQQIALDKPQIQA